MTAADYAGDLNRVVDVSPACDANARTNTDCQPTQFSIGQRSDLKKAEEPPLPSGKRGRVQRCAWLVPAVPAAALIGLLCWAAWGYGYDPRWLAGSRAWWRPVLETGQDWTLAAAVALIAAGLGAYWWPRRRAQLPIALIAVPVMAAVTAMLGTSAYMPCRGQMSTAGVMFWVLQLFVGQPPNMIYQGAPSADACLGAAPPALQLGQIAGLGTTLFAALAVASVLWRGPLNRLRSHFVRERVFDDNGVLPTRQGSKAAQRLLAAAAWLVPAGDRPRYLEEFRAELADLDEAGRSRWTQIIYAVRLLVSAWPLRTELRSPRRRSAVRHK